jgi:chloramphenicol 3-O-phosphotransferase
MKLVLLHGAPATGKFTVGRELAALTGYRFFHNHLVVDVVLAVFDFGTPGFRELREKIWRDVLGRAVQDGIPGLIFTFSPENTVRQDFVDWLFAGLPPHDVRLLSVAVTASEAEIERRIGSAGRREFGKLTDVDLYRRLRDGGTFAAPVIPRTDLSLDTEAHTAAECARQVSRLLGPA